MAVRDSWSTWSTFGSSYEQKKTQVLATRKSQNQECKKATFGTPSDRLTLGDQSLQGVVLMRIVISRTKEICDISNALVEFIFPKVERDVHPRSFLQQAHTTTGGHIELNSQA